VVDTKYKASSSKTKQQIVDINRQKQIRLKQIISNSMMNKSFRECTLENADLLIIDNLRIEEDNKWTRAMIYQIINKRSTMNLPVIITTNITITELKERYDDRTYSRLASMCSFIKNNGEDIRKIQRKEKTDKFMKELFGG